MKSITAKLTGLESTKHYNAVWFSTDHNPIYSRVDLEKQKLLFSQLHLRAYIAAKTDKK